MIFENRQKAGRRLAKKLSQFRNENLLILALPRGGVPIGAEVAKFMHAPLDVIVARKLGAPHNPEFGIGAISEEDTQVLDEHSIKALGISSEGLKELIRKEKEELSRRVNLYRHNKSPPIKNKTIILVDDGLATGVTARAAIEAIKKQKPGQIIFAAPVCAFDTARQLKHLVDNVVCIKTPSDFESVGLWYKEFKQLTDEKVIELLKQSKLAEGITHYKL